MMRSMLKDSNLDRKFQAKLVRTIVYLINKEPIKALGSYFNPYKDLINLHAFPFLGSIKKYLGFYMYTSSFKNPFKKMLLTSI